jgi:prevent-host-death family protein
MRSIGAYEAKTHLPRLLDEVARGETITITKHGVPVAKLVPIAETRRKSPGEAIDEWIAYRNSENIRLDGLSIREMIEEGRR